MSFRSSWCSFCFSTPPPVLLRSKSQRSSSNLRSSSKGGGRSFLSSKTASSSGKAQNNLGDDDADGDDFDDDSVKTEETNEVLNSFEERLELAIEEAREILTEATKRARDETRRELLETFSETFYTTTTTTTKATKTEKFFKGRKENDENKITDENRALNIARTQSFLEIKFKMRDFEAARVAKNLALSKSVYEDCDDLMVQVDRLEKALPDVNVGKLLQNDASIVSSVNVAKAVQNMMTLYELGFKRERVPSMLEECPRLLLDETDLSARDRIRLVTERIQSIFPDETDEGCLYAIGEEPNLLWALADLEIFNREARVDIAELPMSVQGKSLIL
jgi:hypothetical protein|tara:strand:- start:472 stop:1476 length:1005 start_codon:yes stop_codon:yes gene_type:complete